jgi:hypothetical protein
MASFSDVAESRCSLSPVTISAISRNDPFQKRNLCHMYQHPCADGDEPSKRLPNLI